MISLGEQSMWIPLNINRFQVSISNEYDVTHIFYHFVRGPFFLRLRIRPDHVKSKNPPLMKKTYQYCLVLKNNLILI